MKKLVLFAIGVSMLAGLGWYVNRPKPQVVSVEPVVAVATVESAPEPPAAEPTARPPEATIPAAAIPVAAKPVNPTAARASNAALEASFLTGSVDLVVSQATYDEKQRVWKRLRDAGELDQAITELERRIAEEPRRAEYPATLGQAYLQKCATLQDLREQGILAMQADKAFDTALELDPNNWEARFTKAVALSYWPPMLNKGEEVIQHFQTLIQQQEAQTPQPQYAQTYLWLGEQYHKAGREDDARGIWQRGAALFPDYEKLRGKLAAAN
jgi:tetratricopeptide (TPR) repeat protein